MLLSLAGCIVTTLLITFGLAWPFVARAALAPAEKLVAAAALSLVGVFVVAWTVFVAKLPATTLWILPLLAAGGLWFGRAEARLVGRDATARAVMVGQGCVTAWCLGWLATIVSYSGGGWAADWFEHWERARFFLERWPLNYRFIDQYALSARPPLANVVTGAFLQVSRLDFAHYQVVSTVLGSLAFLPAALFAARWAGPAASAVLAVAVMLNPMFVQNATFAWTKLPAAFFILSALWFFVRARDPDAPAPALTWAGTLLAAGLLAHYSAAPYAVAVVLMWLWFARTKNRPVTWWRDSAVAVAAAAVMLGFWFFWSVRVYGPAETFLSNTSASSAHMREGNQLVKIALNIFDTIVPHFLRPLDAALIAQRSSWGAWRDWFFQSYQVNLLLALGSIAWIAAAREAFRARRDAPGTARQSWTIFVVVAALLGIAVHGARDHWGLAHICLQPLVVLALAFLASRWAVLNRGWRIALIAGAAIDFAFGIGLHFAVQSHAIDRWLGAQADLVTIAGTYNGVAAMNAAAKVVHRLAFVRDAFGGAVVAVPFVLAALLAFAAGTAARAIRLRHPAAVAATTPAPIPTANS